MGMGMVGWVGLIGCVPEMLRGRGGEDVEVFTLNVVFFFSPWFGKVKRTTTQHIYLFINTGHDKKKYFLHSHIVSTLYGFPFTPNNVQ